MITRTDDGKVVYRASHANCWAFPKSGEQTVMQGIPRHNAKDTTQLNPQGSTSTHWGTEVTITRSSILWISLQPSRLHPFGRHACAVLSAHPCASSLAEVTQHIPNKGEHQIRYYGHYSNKSRGMREKTQKAALVPKPLAPTSTGSVQRLTQQQLRFRLTPVVSLSNHGRH